MTTPTSAGGRDAVIHEVRRLWGDQLRPVDPSQVYPGLSGRTREFLTTVGLPVFEPDIGIASIHDLADQSVSRNGRQYVVVAQEVGMGLVYAIDVESDEVCLVSDTASSDPAEFANADVALFVLFLGVFEKDIVEASSAVEEGSDEDFEILRNARELLTAMDPEAMREGSSWESRLREYE
jgi:hypothetical protein